MATAGLCFEQPPGSALEGTALLVMARAPGDAGWCAYVLGRDDPVPATPISIAQSYDGYDGHYLLALSAPPLATRDEVEGFVAAVRRYLDASFNEGKRFDGRACIWIPEPATPRFGPPGASAFTFEFGPSGATLTTDLNAVLGEQLTLALPRATAIGHDEAGLTLTGYGAIAIAFLTSSPDLGPAVAPNAARIPLAGAYSGCVLLAGAIVPRATLAYLGAGVRYVHRGEDETPVAHTYPVLPTTGEETLRYAGAIDLLDPLNASALAGDPTGASLRTLLALLPTEGGTTPPPLDSWLRLATGAPVRLAPLGGADAAGQPLAHAGALVLERSGAADSADEDVYLTYAGEWGIAADATAPCPLLCGLFGLERFDVRPYAPGTIFDRLRFVPGRPAYAPGFPFPDASIADPAHATDLLDATHRTAWATVVAGPGAEVDYVAQPEGSALYAHAATARATTAAASAPPVLDWRPTAVALPSTPGFAVPLAPCAGVEESSGAELGAFESQVLAPERRARIAAATLPERRAARAARAARAPGAEPTTPATTPQGFLVQLAGSVYASVTLARSTSGPDLAFGEPDAELQSLLQTNQLFAAIASPAHLGAMPGRGPPPPPGAATFANAVSIAGWTMTADVGEGSTATDYRGVMLLKFCDGTLRERVANPAKWTDADAFSLLPEAGDATTALTGLAQWCSQQIADAIAKHDAGDTLYRTFARIATDPSWRGILVLAAAIAPSGLPPQLRGLAAGIDAAAFRAHHFGVTVTPVAVRDGRLDIAAPSSLFGLVDYELPQYRAGGGASPDVPLPLPVSGDYGFTVLQLQALFENSALSDFRSRVQLSAERLFGSPVTAAYGASGRAPANAVVLRGSYQRQGEQQSYVFEQDTTTVFTLDGNALEAVAVRRAQFNTLTPGADASGAPTIRSRFLFWGTLAFAALAASDRTPYDVLSFGCPPGTEPQALTDGLAFSGLVLDLTSPAATPTAVTYAFDASGLAFDLATSSAREHSLFPTFALALDGFIEAAPGRRLADHGYLTVSLDTPLEALDGPWYGVACTVTMGTPGALVAQAGFSSRLLLAWSPQTRVGAATRAVAAGLQLPGAAPGAKALSLQGVLRLTVDQLELRHDPMVGDRKTRAFTLSLKNVGLTFLGIAKLPPGATINCFLFGDPQGTGSLGWYAAYVAERDRAAEGEQLLALEAGR